MLPIRSLFLLTLFTSWTAAKPIDEIYKLRSERSDIELDTRQQQALTGPVTFQTVTTTQTQAGTIIQTCTITLTPETAQDGSQVVRQDKHCEFEVTTGSGTSQPSNGNGGGNNNGQTTTEVATSFADTATQSQDTNTAITSAAAATGVPPISAIGVNTIPATQTGAVTASATDSAAATVTGAAPPAVSVIGTNQVANTATAVPASSATGSSPVTVLTTLSNGSVSTAITTPSAAAAQEAAATTPGRKLEVLPIGLGVFAGVSVIALIVVGLVTYERTKYRKAFRQRKLAEAGANMGYGGMAERT